MATSHLSPVPGQETQEVIEKGTAGSPKDGDRRGITRSMQLISAAGASPAPRASSSPHLSHPRAPFPGRAET